MRAGIHAGFTAQRQSCRGFYGDSLLVALAATGSDSPCGCLESSRWSRWGSFLREPSTAGARLVRERIGDPRANRQKAIGSAHLPGWAI